MERGGGRKKKKKKNIRENDEMKDPGHETGQGPETVLDLFAG